jgi:hypothetical protein
MTFRLPRKRTAIIATLGLALATLAGGAVSYTYAQSTPQVIRGCVLSVPNPGNNPALGTVRIIKTGETCKPNEQPLDWNQQGIQGPKGDRGLQGPQGAKGDAGAPGSLSVTIRTLADTAEGVATSVNAKVACATGEVATGGGVNYVSGGDFGINSFLITATFPKDNGWAVSVHNTGFAAINFTAFAVCARGAIA